MAFEIALAPAKILYHQPFSHMHVGQASYTHGKDKVVLWHVLCKRSQVHILSYG